MGFSPYGGPFHGFGMFNIIPVIVVVGFIVVFVMIIIRAVQGAAQWHKNNESPVLTVDATIVTKREDVSSHHHSGTDNMGYTTSSTSYYVTFQVASGDRLEFHVPDQAYGMLAENDVGKLTFQGTRFLGFERNKSTGGAVTY